MTQSLSQIVTHPGGSHKDEFLACSLLVAEYPVTIFRREPTPEDLADPETAVVDVGSEHAPERSNFDHHQFPADHPPLCALSLVLQEMGLYEDARSFCDWLEPAERFDTRGPNETAKWLGMDRDTLAKLNSPIDVTLLRRFAACKSLEPGEPLWEIMRWIGQDLIDYLRGQRARLDYLGQNAVVWDVDGAPVLFLPKTDPPSDDPSAGMFHYLKFLGLEKTVVATVYPDRRGGGYGLSRHNDAPVFDFTRISGEADVHFAHARGFVAKSSATEESRLRELLDLARV